MPEIYVDTSELNKLADDLAEHPRQMYAAMASALNRTLTFIGAETKRQVQKEYAVTKSINKSLKMTKATKSNGLTAIAEYRDNPLPMYVFKFTSARNRFRSPIKITIKKSNGAQMHNSSRPALFRAYGRKIMRRDEGEKEIGTAYTVSIPQMVANDKVYNEIAEKAKDHLYKRIEHEVQWRLERINGGSK